MIIHNDGSVTLTKQEVDWLNDNFQGGTHIIVAKSNGYEIIDNECDTCGWGRNINDSEMHRKFMDDFTKQSD